VQGSGTKPTVGLWGRAPVQGVLMPSALKLKAFSYQKCK